MQRLNKREGHLPVPVLVRDPSTLLLYAGLGVLGYLLNGLGAVLGPLQRQLGVDRAQVAFYPSLFAVALVVVGLVGGRVVQRVGHRVTVASALVGLVAGAMLLAAPARPLTLVGAALLGTGGALMVQAVPAALTRRHRTAAASAVGEANAVSSYASVLAPAAVGGAVALGAAWWIGYLLPVLPIAAALLVMLAMRDLLPSDEHPERGAQPPLAGVGLEPARLTGRWVDVLLAVSVEFCLVFWAADAFQEWHGAAPAAAAVLSGAFLLGMALARTATARLTAGHHPLAVVLTGCAVATLGFVAFWAGQGTVAAAAGLLITGTGIALLYPLTVSRLVAAWPHDQDRAAARGALASGLAIGGAPLLLARLADTIGLRTAYLIVPVLLAALALHAATGLNGTRGNRS